jgi:hypothetical protein
LEILHNATVEIGIVVYTGLQCSARLVQEQLGISWDPWPFSFQSARQMMQFTKNPKYRRPSSTSFINRMVLRNTERGEGESSIVFPDFITEFHCLLVLSSEQSSKGFRWRLESRKLNLSIHTAGSESWVAL